MATHDKSKETNINCVLKDVIITPLTCAAFVMEFVKLIIYEKLQIPYPYSWLKSTVKRREIMDNTNQKPTTSISMNTCYSIASKALNFLDNLSRSLHLEFQDESTLIEEVLLCFGSNMSSLHQTYTLRMPTITQGHKEVNHLMDINETVNKLLRNIVLNGDWMKMSEFPLAPTNMHILFKKRYKSNASTKPPSIFFVPKDNLYIPRNSLRFKIDFESKFNKQTLCCSDFIFKDVVVDINVQNHETISNETNDFNPIYHSEQWFQSKTILKGYRDTYINNQSVSDIW